jgi:hypothetical protein
VVLHGSCITLGMSYEELKLGNLHTLSTIILLEFLLQKIFHPICSHKFVKLMQFPMKLLYVPIEARLYLPFFQMVLRFDTLVSTPLHSSGLVVTPSILL